ncbi:MAG: FkbM family methyltransferase [Candidatus Bathyarchaeota archaeon]|nr:FkbM family methyltransferase [Candidatus Bathyarchaeota archaeon]
MLEAYIIVSSSRSFVEIDANGCKITAKSAGDKSSVVLLSVYQPRLIMLGLGANMGKRTAISGKIGAIVIAVEPQDVYADSPSRSYQRVNKVEIVQKAVGAKEVEIKMQISTNTGDLSSCSSEWIDALKARGSYITCVGDKAVRVQMTTSVELIAQFGLPILCKADVEGLEYEVMKGLSPAIEALSLETTLTDLDQRSIQFADSLAHEWLDLTIRYLDPQKGHCPSGLRRIGYSV